MTGIGVTFVTPWYLTEMRPKAEYHSVQQVDMGDHAGTTHTFDHTRATHADTRIIQTICVHVYMNGLDVK
jgi:hypothetical protein